MYGRINMKKTGGANGNRIKAAFRVFLKKLFIYGPYALLALVVLGVVVFLYLSSSLPSVTEPSTRSISQSTKIYDRTGTILLYEVNGGERRTVVPLQDMPAYLKDATISIEDDKFYSEPAFDWHGILRALY